MITSYVSSLLALLLAPDRLHQLSGATQKHVLRYLHQNDQGKACSQVSSSKWSEKSMFSGQIITAVVFKVSFCFCLKIDIVITRKLLFTCLSPIIPTPSKTISWVDFPPKYLFHKAALNHSQDSCHFSPCYVTQTTRLDQNIPHPSHANQITEQIQNRRPKNCCHRCTFGATILCGRGRNLERPRHMRAAQPGLATRRTVWKPLQLGFWDAVFGFWYLFRSNSRIGFDWIN